MLENIIVILEKYGHLFVGGVLTTLQYSAVAVVGGVFFGIIIAFMKTSDFSLGKYKKFKNIANTGIGKFKPLKLISTIYIEVLRGTPILLHLYFFYYYFENLAPFELTKFQAISLALICNSAAYVSEIFRSGIESVDKGQLEAARCLGLSKTQAMIKVVLPQAVKNILPALGNEFIMMIKETSLASTFFAGEIMSQYKVISSGTFLIIEPLIIIGVIYLVLTFSMSKLVGILERKMAESD